MHTWRLNKTDRRALCWVSLMMFFESPLASQLVDDPPGGATATFSVLQTSNPEGLQLFEKISQIHRTPSHLLVSTMISSVKEGSM